MRSFSRSVIPALMVWGLLCGAASAAPGYYRQPDIHGDLVVFAAEEDLWIARLDGGALRRLTSHVGDECFPRFSPDGQSIAFSGDYDGNREVFVVPVEGGEPQRLTWHPDPDDVIGWTPDGKKVIFRSRMTSPYFSWELFMVSAAGGGPEKLPLGWASRLDIDPSSGRWAFVREDLERRTWKRYRGGEAEDIWVGHPDRADFAQVTRFAGKDAFPMWHGGRIYFLSDQGGTSNIWSMNPDGSDRRQQTHQTEWDIRWPAMGPDGRIVFLVSGDIHLFNPADGSERTLAIDLPSDRVLTRTRYPDAAKVLTWFTLAPTGDRVALVMRGEIFSVPVDKGVTLPVTHTSGARESWASYDPKGERLVYITDESGEEAIVSADAWGRGEKKTVDPAGESGWHFPPLWSPDGKWIAYADQTTRLYVVPAQGGDPRVVDSGDYTEINEYVWSPDGRWLAYTKMLPTDYRTVHIYDTREGKTRAVTDWTTDSWSPAWDPDGRYLYFLSDRTVNPLLSYRDLEDVLLRPTKPYLVLLRPDVKDPFAELAGTPGYSPEDQGATEKTSKDKEGDKKKDQEKSPKEGQKEEAAPKPVEIVFEGLTGRVVEVPVDAGLYARLSATNSRIFYLSLPIKGMAEEPDLFDEDVEPDNTLMTFDLKEKEASTFVENMRAYELEPRAGKMAVLKKPGEIYVVAADSPPDEKGLEKGKVSLENIVLELEPREEWKQIYYESWRHMRDFHWDPRLGGLDWKAARDQYAILLPRLATRTDLRDLVGEVIGELSNSHTYVFGGDPGKQVPKVSIGLLGVDVVREGDTFRVTRIYRGDPADAEPSPLTAPGVDVKEGQYILAVNHLPFRMDTPFQAMFDGLAEKEVILTVNDRPALKSARDVVVKTLASEASLRYADWVRGNREYVDRKTGGKIGYIHLPDMSTDGLVEFNTWFYPQLLKEGMIVDARWNAGGFVSQLIVERLRRKIVSFDRARCGGVSTWPYRTLNGPFVVLTNQFAGSDGDIFPAAVQLEGLAPIIGKRSWGGVVGIRGDGEKRMVDGGWLTQPEYAWWDPQGGWSLENRGVIPDIEVENLPQELARGVDAQLDRAITEVMKLHEEHPPVKAAFGPEPVKTREKYQDEK